MSLRRHFAPLAADSISPLNLPPVQMGLLTKLNLLTVGLIFLTAIATTGLYVWKEWRGSEAELRAQGSTLVNMLAEATERGLATDDRANLLAIVNSLAIEGDIAYVRVLDANGRTVAERTFAESLQDVAVPELPRAVPIAETIVTEPVIGGRRYLELVAPVLARTTLRRRRGHGRQRRRPGAAPSRRRPDRLPAARHDVRAAERRVPPRDPERDVRRRLARRTCDRGHAAVDTPARRADAAAHARGTRGRLRQARRLRASELRRRARAAHAHVQPHDAAARRIAGRGGDLPAHARGQGRAADEGARDRDCARLQARAARHPHRASQPLAPEPAVEADPRAGAAGRRRTSLACSSISTTSSESTTRSATIPAISSCRRSRSG